MSEAGNRLVPQVMNPASGRAGAQRPNAPHCPTSGRPDQRPAACALWHVAAFPVFRQGNVYDPLSEMNMVPAKPEQLTTTHPGLDSQNDKWRPSPIARGEQALFLPQF